MRLSLQTPELITSSQLAGMLIAGSNWLKIHVDQVNALNVFPVPDGDTGINMLLTMQAALAEIHHPPTEHAGALATLVSQGALLGARGNSGVILSQILCGFAETIQDKEAFSIPEFAGALQAAADCAYQAVLTPVEGTILTVIKMVAQTAQQLAEDISEVDRFLGYLLAQAKQTLSLTPDLLPILKEAGVVDSGGLGLVYLLEGMAHYVKGTTIDISAEETIVQAPTSLNRTYLPAPGYSYDIQFLIKGEKLDVEAIRETVNTMGASPLVVGNENLVKVHVHVADPGLPLSFGVTQGTLLDVAVENMAEQYQAFFDRQQPNHEPQTRITTICVATGPGLAEIFKSLGANVILSDGQIAKPSTRDFLEAISRVKADNVLVLPNDRNILLTAQQSGNLSQKRVLVVPTKSIPQGINALLSFNAEAELKTNFERMKSAAQQVHTLEITQAAQATTLHNRRINRGDIIALGNGTLIATGQDLNQVSLNALETFNLNQVEVLTIYYGANATPTAVQTLLQSIQAIHPNLEIEVLNGGQPHYPYIISLE
jgi:DAK2 domain fusion protein YloV